MRLLIVERDGAEHLAPLTWTRPSFELLAGMRSQRARLVEELRPREWGVVVRPYLAETYRAQFPTAHVNEAEWIEAEETIVVDGQFLGDPLELIRQLVSAQALRSGEQTVAWRRPAGGAGTENLCKLLREENWPVAVESTVVDLMPGDGQRIDFLWDLVASNARWLTLDFELRRQAGRLTPPAAELAPGIVADDPAHCISVASTAVVEPYVCLNALAGPIVIDEGAVLQAFTRVEGPCYIGPGTHVFRGNIRGETSLGPVCRIGGEVEASIVQGYTNKYHDGFLGHSFVGSWCNLGALTSNSDLKNDYSDVRVVLGTESVATGSRKIGGFVGDHTKTAIGTLLNTGAHVGVMSLVLPAGRLCPKLVPSFSRLWNGVLDDELDFAAACRTAAIAMERRGLAFTAAEERLLAVVRELTAEERAAAIARQTARG